MCVPAATQVLGLPITELRRSVIRRETCPRLADAATFDDVDDQRLIEVGDVRLACRTWGDPSAPPVILLHGLGSDGSTWDERGTR